MAAHVFMGDEVGDCQHCPLPEKHPSHLRPEPKPTVTTADKRPTNLLTKDEGMALAATSQSSEEFRTTFFLAMAEVATTREFFSTNDAWDLLEARGYARSTSAQATGTIGPSGCSIGLWLRTDQKAINTSGNLHSSDDGVRVYKSLVLRKDFHEDVAPLVRVKAQALREKAEAREAAKAPPLPTIPEDAVEREEWRMIDPEGITSPLLAAHVEQARGTLSAWKIERRTVIETPWVEA